MTWYGARDGVVAILPILVGVSFLVFLILHLVPEDVAAIMPVRARAAGRSKVTGDDL
jgi:hypothetical protein